MMIDTNDTDILALQTATGVLRTDIDNNDTDIAALQTATGVLRTDIDNNDTDIAALQTATGVISTITIQTSQHYRLLLVSFAPILIVMMLILQLYLDYSMIIG
jgi:hypothetical protein